LTASLYVPQPDRGVITGRGQQPAVGAEDDAADATRVAAERVDLHATARVADRPDLDGLVPAADGEVLAGGAEGHAANGPAVLAELEGWRAGRHVPDVDTVVAHRGQQRAVRAEGHAVEPAGPLIQGADVAGLQVPDLGLVVVAGRGQVTAVG